MKWALDRKLPISLNEQIKGQIMFAISYGDLKPGDSLPSVRKLAQDLNVSPMTISKVYRELVDEGLIYSKPCVGNFVSVLSSNGEIPNIQFSQENLRQMVDTWIRQALLMGHSLEEIHNTFDSAIDLRMMQTQSKTLALVGSYLPATESYCKEIETILNDLNIHVIPTLFSDFKADPRLMSKKIEPAKIVITFAHQLQELRSLMDLNRFKVVSMEFHLSEKTRKKIALISNDKKVGIISTLPEFMQTMKNELGVCGVSVPSSLCAVQDQTDRIKNIMKQIDILVYASGSESALSEKPNQIEAIEFLHSPDPASVNRLRALIE